jgi:hypothetical protein
MSRDIPQNEQVVRTCTAYKLEAKRLLLRELL